MNKKMLSLSGLGLIALFISLFVGSTPAAAKAAFTVEIEPIAGYERNQKLVPTRHTTDRFIYGAVVTVGIPLIALEAEYLRGQDNESFPDLGLSVKDTDDKAKLGIRGRFKLSNMLSAFARAGGQAKRNIHEVTLAGVTTRTERPIKYAPYAGAGLRAWMSRTIAFEVGMTVVFNDFPDMTDNEYQTTAGVVVKLGSKRRRR